MKEEEERVLYWDAVSKLQEIIEAGNMSREEILSELDDDL